MTADIHTRTFAQILAKLPPNMPITRAYDTETRRNPHLYNQGSHMTRWFRSQTTTGTGQYTRRQPNYSAQTTYNRLQSPGGLLWINEALGISPTRVKAAAQAAKAEKDHRRKCHIIRQILPWEAVYQKAKLAERRE